MQKNELEQNNEINLTNKNELEQNNFIESILGKTINTALDIGIRTIFPQFIEDQIINIKDNLLTYGLKDGIQQTINDTIELGKSAIGIITGEFENINQVENAIQSGGIIDGMSSLIDTVINKVTKSGLIKYSVANTIKQGKNIILNNIENNIQKTFKNQYKSIENLDKYINNWNKQFTNKNFKNMEKEYKKVEEELKNIVPLQEIINKAKIVENIHSLIKNNGERFELSKEELELAKNLL